jgi:arylsulfatase A
VRWPGVVEPGSHCHQPVGLTDVMATVADALGVELEPASAEDSRSLVEILKGVSEEPLADGLVQHSISGQFAIRQGPWKLCFCPGSGAGPSLRMPKPRQRACLPFNSTTSLRTWGSERI